MKRILDFIHASYAYRLGLDGRGIGAAVLDTGICAHHDLGSRIMGFYDFVNGINDPYDDNGHGTHISGIIGASADAEYPGVAPQCSLYGYKVLDQNGNGSIDTACRALEKILEENSKHPGTVRVANISVGMTESVPPGAKSRLIHMVEKVWDSGVVVLAAAGNNGPGENTVTSPGISKKIITVGSLDDGSRDRFRRGYSGRGPTDECVVKPEILMPGTNIYSCAGRRYGYVRKSGTSMAVPVLAGAIVLLLQAYPYLTPNQVKIRLFYAARKTGLAKDRKCWGTITMDHLL